MINEDFTIEKWLTKEEVNKIIEISKKVDKPLYHLALVKDGNLGLVYFDGEAITKYEKEQ